MGKNYMIKVLDDINDVVVRKEICVSRKKAKEQADNFLVEGCVKNNKVREVRLIEDGVVVYAKGKGDLRVELAERGVR